MKITLDQRRSWRVAAEIDAMSPEDQDRLLKHEQGHYDLTALIGRDFFNALWQLRLWSSHNSAQIRRGISDVAAAILYKSQPVNDLYDTKTAGSRNHLQQERWNGFIQKAFFQPRTPDVIVRDIARGAARGATLVANPNTPTIGMDPLTGVLVGAFDQLILPFAGTVTGALAGAFPPTEPILKVLRDNGILL